MRLHIMECPDSDEIVASLMDDRKKECVPISVIRMSLVNDFPGVFNLWKSAMEGIVKQMIEGLHPGTKVIAFEFEPYHLN